MPRQTSSGQARAWAPRLRCPRSHPLPSLGSSCGGQTGWGEAPRVTGASVPRRPRSCLCRTKSPRQHRPGMRGGRCARSRVPRLRTCMPGRGHWAPVSPRVSRAACPARTGPSRGSRASAAAASLCPDWAGCVSDPLPCYSIAGGFRAASCLLGFPPRSAVCSHAVEMTRSLISHVTVTLSPDPRS